MYQVLRKRKLLLETNKYLKPGDYIITKHRKPVLRIRIETCTEWPGEKQTTKDWR